MRKSGQWFTPAVVVVTVVSSLAIDQAYALGPGWDFVFEFGGFGGVVPDVAVDSQGDVYVVDGVKRRVQVFSPTGEYLRERAGFTRPVAVDVDENDVVYILELCRVHRFTLDFQPLGSWDSCIGQGDLQHGQGMDVRDGIVYVGTVNALLKFTAEGKLLTNLTHGTTWRSVYALPDGSAWVVTPVGFARHYSSDGDVLDEWPTAIGNESSEPSGMTMDSNERLYITDEGARVKIFASNGDLVDLISVQLRFFTGLELDGDSILYVAAAVPERVMKFVYTSVPVNPTTWGGIKAQFQLEKPSR